MTEPKLRVLSLGAGMRGEVATPFHVESGGRI